MDVVLESPPASPGFPADGTGPDGARFEVPPQGIDCALYLGDQRFRVTESGPFARLYAGWEFCAARIGSAEHARETVLGAVRQGAPVTLVTPPTRTPHLGFVLAAIEAFARQEPVGEVVVNDWGILRETRRLFPDLVLILGRLLFRMHRDPDSPLLRDATARGPSGGLTQLDSPAFLRMVRDLGIRRVEADLVRPGFPLPPGWGGPQIAVHSPFRYLSQTFSCRAAGLLRAGPPMPIDGCRRECDDLTVLVERKRGPIREIHVGNAVFLRNPGPLDLEPGRGVDRLVVRRQPLL